MSNVYGEISIFACVPGRLIDKRQISEDTIIPGRILGYYLGGDMGQLVPMITYRFDRGSDGISRFKFVWAEYELHDLLVGKVNITAFDSIAQNMGVRTMITCNKNDRTYIVMPAGVYFLDLPSHNAMRIFNHIQDTSCVANDQVMRELMFMAIGTTYSREGMGISPDIYLPETGDIITPRLASSRSFLNIKNKDREMLNKLTEILK